MARFRRCPPILPLCLGVFLALSTLGGCSSHNCELVESALHDRECKLREVCEELERLRMSNAALEREVGGTRNFTGKPLPTPELASQSYTLTSITLAQQTGGYNNDKLPGDDALQVVLEPRDPDKSAIKAPGTMDVFAYEINREGLKKLIGSWRVSPEQLRKNWKSGILSTGYFVTLPWKAFPTIEKMRLLVRFTLNDGRTFEADKDFSVTLVDVKDQKILPSEYPDAPLIMEPLPGGGPDLPVPKKVEPPLAPADPTFPPAPRPTGAEPAAHWQPAKTPTPSGPVIELLKPVPRSGRSP